MIRSSGESIGCSKLAARDMVELKIVLAESELPAGLPACQRLRGSEIQEVLVVSEDDHRMGIAFEEVSPCLQGTDNRKKLSVVDLIIPFRSVKGLRKISTWVVGPIVVGL